ncbi:unnamed protein product [Aphanomyces euteiches]
MDLKTSATLDANLPNQAAALKSQFASHLAAGQAALHATIKEAAAAEIDALEAQVPLLRARCEDQLKRYFSSCISSLQLADANGTPGRPGLPAAGGLDINFIIQTFNDDLSLSLSFLSQALNKASYEHVLQVQARETKRAEAQAARAAAEEMEVDTPNDILVGQLVKREITKNMSALRKELNTLRAALNDKPNRRGNSVGKTGKTPTPRGSGGGKAQGQPQERRNSKPKNNPGKQKGNGAEGAKKHPAQAPKKKPPPKKNN